jgi:beta-galactosidase
VPAATGGSPAVTGGSLAVTGGAPGPSGGTSTSFGGTTSNTGGVSNTGGQPMTGGQPITGGQSITGGQPITGGKSTTGGQPNTGGQPTAGGQPATGGTAQGGSGAGGSGVGGQAGKAGSISAGSPAGGTGGTAGTAGTGGSTTTLPRVRTITAFDNGWLFNVGDPANAQATTFVDTGWRTLNVPHDWSIEGASPPSNPFSSSAATTGRGGYAPSGVAWYRKHFTLPASASGDKFYIEFDGVMANASFYVNGTLLGQHPYGYVSLRYDMTSAVFLGGKDNVVAVRSDTSVQPAERFYTGAGIYRHVRMIETNPVHVDQWATYIQTPAPTTTSATVNVQTTVLNSGTASQSVTVQGVVTSPSGVALAPVTTAAQTVAAGARVDFTFSVPVSNPQLWDLQHPNMYQLVTNVQVGGATVDDDVQNFGIREIVFNSGMTLNGKSLKFQGVANHQDYHALGMAAPQRAIQRRLAQLKALGVNAWRTAHDPPSPDFLDMTDRMGILVLDEFADTWTTTKYADVGDYSKYFNVTASTPTGMPPLPAVTGVTDAGAPWYQVDFTGWIMRDRNHPSVALYSVGNEIGHGVDVRTPFLTKMIAMSHALDPSRSDTQALQSPASIGDYPGTVTSNLLDVWGDNYDLATCLKAMLQVHTKSGLLTEFGTETSTWASVTANPGLTGEFMWTGVDYLGEADKAWPQIGNTSGIMDELGGVKDLGYQWQTIWGAPKTTPPATGTTATQVVLTADHASIVTDWNDISFVKATITDAAGSVVTSSSAAITFGINGPGTIVAVDSASMTNETFRGKVRSAYQGIAYALVQATGPGTITVTASVSGLTGSSATIQATAGIFAPCSGTCD